MSQKLPVNRAAVNTILGHVKPLSSMTHEVGMAAVAAELHLDLDDLELDIGVALAIRRGGGVREDRNRARHRRCRGHDPGRWRCRLASHRIDNQLLELNDEMLAVGQEAATLGCAAQQPVLH